MKLRQQDGGRCGTVNTCCLIWCVSAWTQSCALKTKGIKWLRTEMRYSRGMKPWEFQRFRIRTHTVTITDGLTISFSYFLTPITCFPLTLGTEHSRPLHYFLRRSSTFYGDVFSLSVLYDLVYSVRFQTVLSLMSLYYISWTGYSGTLQSCLRYSLVESKPPLFPLCSAIATESPHWSLPWTIKPWTIDPCLYSWTPRHTSCILRPDKVLTHTLLKHKVVLALGSWPILAQRGP